MGLVAGNLVRWSNAREGVLGVVTSVPAGNRIVVRMDSGEEMTFAWPTSVIERVQFAAGDHVQLRSESGIGVVVGVQPTDGQLVYTVALSGGYTKAVPESGLRPAVMSDPAELLRQGKFASARATNLRLAALRLSYAHQFDELSSLSNSRVEIKPHQVSVVHRVATNYPHRFLLADEVGLGKTIEAGLIIKELKTRGVANRVLILAPSGIVSQWQFELKSKFSQTFAHYNRATMGFLQSQNPGENVWTLTDNVIASTTFAAHDEARRQEIALAGWDLVVIDEAHHARRQWQGETRYTETNLYRLASALADPDMGRALGFLLLTATPMQLHRFELYSLIELLDPALFVNFEDFDKHAGSLAGLNATVDAVRRWEQLPTAEKSRIADQVARYVPNTVANLQDSLQRPAERETLLEGLAKHHRLSDVLIRNRKANVGGFQPRVAGRWSVEMTPIEWEAYNAATEYVRSGFARSRATQNNALGFLMAVFQKLNSSSSYALRESLRRRAEKLSSELRSVVESVPEEEEFEEQHVGEALDDLLGLEAQVAVLEEVNELRRIIGLLDQIEIDSKTLALLEGLAEIATADHEAKVIIFTQFRDTQDYIARHLPRDWVVSLFHGQLSPAEKDSAVARFRDQEVRAVLISTEAGGEGRNFQFCHHLVNYDLPWNPMKIEQRIGRLDRIGQKHPIKIFNFAVAGTIEERVLEVLDDRIRVFEETIGGLDPILGEVEVGFRHIFLSAEAEAVRALKSLDRDLDARIREARNAEKRLADLIMDSKSFRQDEVQRLLDRRGSLDHEAMKRFVLTALKELGCLIADDHTMPGVFDVKLRGQYLNEFPQIARDGIVRRVTFEPSVALDYESIEFLAFGHEIVDGLVERMTAREYTPRTSVRAIRTDDQRPQAGWFFVYALEYEGVVRGKELFPVFVSASGEKDDAMGSWLLERSSRLKWEDGDNEGLKHAAVDLDQALGAANASAIRRLLDRQDSLADTNRARLEAERDKLMRYYDYRAQAAEEKLEAVRRTFGRVSESEDPEVQRIVPVWAKNLENAKRVIVNLAGERERRLSDLTRRDHVAAQHELIAASYVEIVPKDKAPSDHSLEASSDTPLK